MQRCSSGALLAGGPHLASIVAPRPTRQYEAATRPSQSSLTAATGITSTSGRTTGRSEWRRTMQQACAAHATRIGDAYPGSWDHSLTVQRDKSAHASHLDSSNEQGEAPQVLSTIVRFLKHGQSGPAGAAALRLSERIYKFVSEEQHAEHAGATLAVASALLLPSLLLKTMQLGDVEHMLSAQLLPVLHDSLLILRAANVASMDARSFADWCLESCSTQAALAAVLFCQATSRLPHAHTNLQALAARLGLPAWSSEPAPLQLAECHTGGVWSSTMPLLAPVQHVPARGGAPAARARAHRMQCSATPPGATSTQTALPVSTGSTLDAASAQQGRTIEARGEVRVRGLNASPQFMAASGSSRDKSGDGNNNSQPPKQQQQQEPTQQQEPGPHPGVRAFNPAPSTSTSTASAHDESDEERGEEDWLSRQRQRRRGSGLLARPQRTMSDDEDAAEPAETQLGSRPAPPDLEAAYNEAYASDDDEEFGLGRLSPQPQPPPPKQRRLARALPMQLVPLSDTYPLLDPATRQVLTGPGQQASSRAGVAQLPLLGPFVVSNHVASFPTTDALLDYTAGNNTIKDRLCMRLEYVVQREGVEEKRFAQEFNSLQSAEAEEGGAGRAAPSAPPVQQQQTAAASSPDREQEPEVLSANLQMFNVSRRVRGRTGDCVMRVTRASGHELSVMPGDPGVRLRPGDVISFGAGPYAPQFRVAVQAGGPSSNAAIMDVAVDRHCAEEAAQIAAAAAAQAGAGKRTRGGGRMTAANLMALSMPQVAKLSRSDPQAAYSAYCSMLAGRYRANPFAWVAAAQLAASMGRLRTARDMFRAAVAAASAGGGLSGSDDLLDQSAQQPQQVQDLEGGAAKRQQPGATAAASAQTPATGLPVSKTALPHALVNWARFEWGFAKLQGAARHLWRAAADAAMLHPAGPSVGGVGIVLHSWASAELSRNNVMNARVVVAEALRKCPQEQPLYVLAASVELAGADYELARAFCLRAYEMDRTDKHLYTVWPLVMAAMGEKDKARVLFERGLDYHPQNTKIMHAYAVFEAEKGDTEAARELHVRALSVDPLSLTSMTNRVAWAHLEADQGNLDGARALLQEGLEAHPQHVPALIELARTERMAGEVALAQELLRDASRLTHAFDLELLKERATLMRVIGERDLSAALEAHLRAVTEMEAAKKAGARTADAWAAYVAASSTPERRKLAREAHRRKQQLGFASEKRGVPGSRAATQANPGLWRPIPARVRVPVYQPPPPCSEDEDEAEEGEEGAGDVGPEQQVQWAEGPGAVEEVEVEEHVMDHTSAAGAAGSHARATNGHSHSSSSSGEDMNGHHASAGSEDDGEDEGEVGRPMLARSRPQDTQ